MPFITIKNVKLGNMRKAADWTAAPSRDVADGLVTMQCDRRIARVDLNAGTAILSSGKGGHQGFAQLMPIMGAVQVDVPPDVIEKIKRAMDGREDYKSGSVVLIGDE